ncbi:MAG: metallophosphoesterase [Verrucomicrobia bacterium]|nr:metallophosphoesterase [Verrucomicrobiota bacterium]
MATAFIAPELILDSNLALIHSRDRWMAVADLHYGFELSQRAAGWLIPFWGMGNIESRLRNLIEEHGPDKLILVGDIVHSSVAQRQAEAFVQKLSHLGPELILVRGNHDRGLRELNLIDCHTCSGFCFKHGHLDITSDESLTEVSGHLHPSWSFNDGAGARVRAPALLQMEKTIVLPAFSPWAAGVRCHVQKPHRLWVCGKKRVFAVEADTD